jgi:hypothetical protein
VRDDPVYEEAL